LRYIEDGTTWQHCWTTSAFTEIVALGDRLILFDSDSDTFLVWDEP
jgi:hypothetical protein